MNKRHEIPAGREVGQIAAKLSLAMGCNPCGIGKAIDIVGERWGEPPFDWAGAEAQKVGHRCKNTTWSKGEEAAEGAGAFVISDAEKNRRVAEIQARLEEWAKTNTDVPAAADYAPDTRLPPERDEELTS